MLHRSLVRAIRPALGQSYLTTGVPAVTLKSIQLRTATTVSNNPQSSVAPVLLLAQRWASTASTTAKAKKPAAKKAATPTTKKAAAVKPKTKAAAGSKVKAKPKAKAKPKVKAKPKKRVVKKKVVAKKVVKRPADHKRQSINALGVFLKERAPAHRDAAEFVELKGPERLKAVGDKLRAEWAGLSETEKDTYRVASLRERIRRGASPEPYLREVVPGLKEIGPLSSFFIFTRGKQNVETGRGPETFKAVNARAKELGQEFRALTTDEKNKFIVEALDNQRAQKAAIADWVKTLSGAALADFKADLERGRRTQGHVYKVVNARAGTS